MEHDLARRARTAARGRLAEIGRDDDVDDDLTDEARRNLERIWRKVGFDENAEPDPDEPAEGTPDTEHIWPVTDLEAEALTAAREAVVAARAEPGMDPTVVDGVLRKLDGHGVTLD